MKKSENIIILFFLCLALCINVYSQPKNSEEIIQTTQRIQSYMDKLEEAGFMGSVLVELGGEKILSNGYGYSNLEQKIKNTPGTIFDIGSITKQFTAAAILKLEMQGKLSTDDKISKYFANVPIDKQAITIHHLLRHASGLPGVIGGDYEKITETEFVDSLMRTPLGFESGTDFGYSNVGYSLLAMIVEKVSGQQYEEYLYENLWKPSGMESTGYSRPAFIKEMIATGYKRDNTAWGKPVDKPWDKDAPYWHLKGNGGILSTTEDMYRWHLALMGDKILSKEAKEKYYHPKQRVGENPDSYYAYGWDVHRTKRNTTYYWHNGANRIFYAEFYRYVDEGVTILLMTNKSQPDFNQAASDISLIIFYPSFKPVVPAADNEANRNFTNEIIDIILSKGAEAGIDAYKNNKTGARLIESVLNVKGYDLIEEGKFQQAIDIFSVNILAYPDSYNAFDSIGEAYMDAGNNKLAIENYKKSLQLNPENNNAVQMLKKLEGK